MCHITSGGNWCSWKLVIERRNAVLWKVLLLPAQKESSYQARELHPSGRRATLTGRNAAFLATCSDQTSWPFQLLTAHYLTCESGNKYPQVQLIDDWWKGLPGDLGKAAESSKKSCDVSCLCCTFCLFFLFCFVCYCFFGDVLNNYVFS